jgi:hypothetical protein
MKYNDVKIIYGPLREEYFSEKNPANLIVLRKNEIYFNKDRLSMKVDQTGYRHAKQLIEKWQAGQSEFSLVAQNTKLLIFKRAE